MITFVGENLSLALNPQKLGRARLTLGRLFAPQISLDEIGEWCSSPSVPLAARGCNAL
jgi:hypothetical protein